MKILQSLVLLELVWAILAGPARQHISISSRLVNQLPADAVPSPTATPSPIPTLESVEINGVKSTLAQKLGAGAYATTFLTNEEPPAVVKIYKDRSHIWTAYKGISYSPPAVVQFENEVEILRKLDRLIDSSNGNEKIIKMKLEKGITLENLLETRNLTHVQHKQLVEKVIEAIDRLHEQGILHQDYNTGNIMIEMDGEIIINAEFIDFGLSVDLKCDKNCTFEQNAILNKETGRLRAFLEGTEDFSDSDSDD